ncbi:MAG: glycosyltransferase family 39 protein, partial [bacterium]
MHASRTGALWLCAAVVAGGLARIVLAGRLPIGDDEAYYWLWSQHLAWSYPDHPPMIAAVVAASTHLFGDGVLGIRALAVLIATVTPLAVYVAGRDLFDERAAMLAGLITAMLPAFAVGTVFAFPDAPLALFWGLALWAGWRALQEGGWWWVATGAAVGLALLSKLTAFALVLGFAGALAAGGWRRAVRDPGFYAGILVAAALFAPVVIWNARHDWFLLHITLSREPWMTPRSIPENLLFFVGGQILYYGALAPVLVGAAIAGVRRRHPALRYLAWMSLPLLIAMGVAALGARPKPHWPGPAYVSMALALGALWDEWTQRRPGLFRASVALTAGTTAALFVALLLPWGPEQVRLGIGHWERVADAISRQTVGGTDRVLVLTDTYQAA